MFASCTQNDYIALKLTPKIHLKLETHRFHRVTVQNLPGGGYLCSGKCGFKVEVLS
jgi:hypothetical protein